LGERLIESFNARLRDELLNGEIFYTLREAQIVIESWRRHYNPASQHPSAYVIGVGDPLEALRSPMAEADIKQCRPRGKRPR
jgi:hypothetical protein